MARPRLAVYKFSSCDGCQLSLLDCEDELLALAGAVEIAYFLEASRQALPGPYDVVLVEGSVTTEEEVERLKEVRRQAKLLVAIGACATAGGIQALRNWADADAFRRAVYPTPGYIRTLDRVRPLGDVVLVDAELRGCPISKRQLLDFLAAVLIGRTPRMPAHSVCTECKRRGAVCVMVASGVPCLGPVTQAGCGAICPAYARGCYGCFGPMERPNTGALGDRFVALGQSRDEVARAFRGINAYALPFAAAGDRFARSDIEEG
ncbi:MAG: oxidoreductase [Armatimonadota bacterium]|nr:oxidoreductase [Armatimonadota bacterium]MDR7422279.1 oxidoreductase [Armatimonadota bacterium]MDR7453770.1 oxidoreductase [Armatimonadota bacterium]MDR7456298.1 oxidoreductase [Armatimonadota bacterium]MDR7496295.1 oxidoreductase [Armatimonadota bacterium]